MAGKELSKQERDAWQASLDASQAKRVDKAPRGGSTSWIFVSHSNKDFEEVRKVRDALELLGHRPLLFFLKCLGDEAELELLLRREIEARDFFLLCNSKNASTSRYVDEEVRYIKSLPGKVYESIDLDSNWNAQIEAIESLSRRATVYLSYSAEDTTAAQDIAAALTQRDFRVLGLGHSLAVGEAPEEEVERLILEALKYGFVLVLLSERAVSKDRSFQFLELKVARDLDMRFAPGRARLIPVVWSDYEAVAQRIAPWLGSIQLLDASKGNPKDKPGFVVEALLRIARGDS